MTSHLEPFDVAPGYQFQDGDEWLNRPSVRASVTG